MKHRMQWLSGMSEALTLCAVISVSAPVMADFAWEIRASLLGVASAGSCASGSWTAASRAVATAISLLDTLLNTELMAVRPVSTNSSGYAA